MDPNQSDIIPTERSEADMREALRTIDSEDAATWEDVKNEIQTNVTQNLDSRDKERPLTIQTDDVSSTDVPVVTPIQDDIGQDDGKTWSGTASKSGEDEDSCLDENEQASVKEESAAENTSKVEESSEEETKDKASNGDTNTKDDDKVVDGKKCEGNSAWHLFFAWPHGMWNPLLSTEKDINQRETDKLSTLTPKEEEGKNTTDNDNKFDKKPSAADPNKRAAPDTQRNLVSAIESQNSSDSYFSWPPAFTWIGGMGVICALLATRKVSYGSPGVDIGVEIQKLKTNQETQYKKLLEIERIAQPEPFLLDLLSPISGDALLIAGSSQHQALEWLVSSNPFASSNITQSMLIERYILAQFYFATNGQKWTQQCGFLSSASVCDWKCNNSRRQGVDCDETGAVARISLASNGLKGTLATEIGSLVHLRDLDLNGNALQGNIPSEIGSLVNLKVLKLGQMQMSGTIPSEIGRLTRLGTLYLFANQLTGSLPRELGNMIALRDLQLFSNPKLSGSVPNELDKLSDLAYLFLHNTDLSGSLNPIFCNEAECPAGERQDSIYLVADCSEQNRKMVCDCCTVCF